MVESTATEFSIFLQPPFAHNRYGSPSHNTEFEPMSDSDPSAEPHEIPDQVRDDVLRDGPSPGSGAGSVPPRDERVVSKFPSPKRPPRHDEWTRPKMVAFLRELAATQSVSQAAKSVGMSRQSAYKLRNRLSGTPFALAWEVA